MYEAASVVQGGYTLKMHKIGFRIRLCAETKVYLCNSAPSPFRCAVVWYKIDYYILINIKYTGNKG